VASLDASTGQGEARIVDSALRKGVRMELVVAPVSFLLPALIGGVFVDLGLRHGAMHYVALGVLLFLGNVVFDYLMVRTALRFLRGTKPPGKESAPPAE
jgi:hypothetical protein